MTHLPNTNNPSGFSVVEMLVAAGLSAFIIAMTVTPIVQMKTLEAKVEFQAQLTTAHQMALQKSRNGFFLKDPANLNIVPGNLADQCFGGRGVGCAALAKTAWTPIDNFVFTKPPFSATSNVSIKVDCLAEKCTQVQVQVQTTVTDTSHSLNTKPLIAQFNIPAAALSSRQEIDFSLCAGKVVTGINYTTLKAECVAAGNSSCSAIPGAGPILTFGPNVDFSDPTNCQVPVDETCANGLGRFGMISGQSSCAPPPACSDPFSTACPVAPPVTLPPACVSNWQPADNAVCLGQSFPQTDLNNCPPGPANRTSTGTNAAVCIPSSCNFIGNFKWPDPATGPCSRTGVSLTAAPSSTTFFTNDNLGYVGTVTLACDDLSPAPAAFNWPAAAQSCTPILCSGVPTTLKWSATAVFDGSAGPWDCDGPVTVNQTPAEAPGILRSFAIDGATATFSNTASTATSGGGTITCVDPGPAGSPRAGALSFTGLTCLPSAAPPVVNGSCGLASGAPSASPPTIDLCSTGTATAVAGAGPYTWNCDGSGGGSNASCATTMAPMACSGTYGWVQTCGQTGTPFAFGSYCESHPLRPALVSAMIAAVPLGAHHFVRVYDTEPVLALSSVSVGSPPVQLNTPNVACTAAKVGERTVAFYDLCTGASWSCTQPYAGYECQCIP